MFHVIETTALRVLDFLEYPPLRIEAGSFTFLTGESGSGKSTLLRLLNGTISPQEGQIFYEGRDIAQLDTIALRRALLLVSQEVYLFDGSIAENFIQFHAYREQPAPEIASMQRYLALCCADFPLSSRCESLSGGERQRVFLAICLSFMPSVLLLDEPTAALDDETGARFFEKLRAHASEEGMSLLCICHNSTLTERFAEARIHLVGRSRQ